MKFESEFYPFHFREYIWRSAKWQPLCLCLTVLIMVKILAFSFIIIWSGRYVFLNIQWYIISIKSISKVCFQSWRQIPYLTMKIQGQSHGQGQTWWSHLRSRVQSICLLFVSWQSDHFLSRDIANSMFNLENSSKGHGQGQTWWSHLSPRILMICLLFVSW